jgi:hypothetical protein
MTYCSMLTAQNVPFPSTITITFSNQMNTSVPSLYSPATYRLNHGAYVTSVTILNSTSVILVAENLFGYSTFTLSMNAGPISIEGYLIDTSQILTITMNMPTSDGMNSISAANGRLKSGQNALKVASDKNNFYVMTESGIDVIDKHSLFNKGFILQESGFNTFCIGGEDD